MTTSRPPTVNERRRDIRERARAEQRGIDIEQAAQGLAPGAITKISAMVENEGVSPEAAARRLEAAESRAGEILTGKEIRR